MAEPIALTKGQLAGTLGVDHGRAVARFPFARGEEVVQRRYHRTRPATLKRVAALLDGLDGHEFAVAVSRARDGTLHHTAIVTDGLSATALSQAAQFVADDYTTRAARRSRKRLTREAAGG